MLDFPTRQIEFLAFRLVSGQAPDHPILNVWDRIKKERYGISKSENCERYRKSLEMVRTAWYRPADALILADYLDENGVYAEWAPVLRQRQTVLRFLLTLQFCGARARHYVGSFKTKLQDMAYNLAMKRSTIERDQFILGERPNDTDEEAAEEYGYPFDARARIRYVPEHGHQYIVRKWPQHTIRLLYAGLDGYRVPSDCEEYLRQIINRVGDDLKKYKAMPWWGFKI